MARPDSLIVGAIFFLVHYYDEDLLVPDIQTLEYWDRTTSDDGTDLWFFREPSASVDPDADEPSLTGFDESQLHELVGPRRFARAPCS